MKTSIESRTESSNVVPATGPEALFYFHQIPDRTMDQLIARIRQETRSLGVRAAPGAPRALFLGYHPDVVDLQDIRQDLERGGIDATLVTC